MDSHSIYNEIGMIETPESGFIPLCLGSLTGTVLLTVNHSQGTENNERYAPYDQK